MKLTKKVVPITKPKAQNSVKANKAKRAEVEKLAQRYLAIQEQLKALEAEKKKIAEKVKAEAEVLGTKDDKGSYYIEFEDVVAGKVAYKNMSLKHEETLKLLKKKKLVDCYEDIVVTSLKEDVIAQHVSSGDISLKEIEAVTQTDTSYRVLIKNKEDMPEIQQSSFVAKKR